MLVFSDSDAVSASVGMEVGVSPWLLINQPLITRFADATGDHQWIHVDEARAADGPYGRTIAHGFLVLSLLPSLSSGAVSFEGFFSRVNYGVNRVRFPAPVRVGARIRDRVRINSATVHPAGLQVGVGHTVELENQPKPACVAETVLLLT